MLVAVDDVLSDIPPSMTLITEIPIHKIPPKIINNIHRPMMGIENRESRIFPTWLPLALCFCVLSSS